MKRKRELEQAGTSHVVMDDFDVFLNHRGPDVKATFVAHLEEALRCAGFRPFLDARSLMKGNPALKSIDQALAMAQVHVAIVSRGYAESKYCLNELVAMVRSGKPVVPVFYDVEPVDLRWVENGPFAKAFEKHKSKGRAQEKVQEWRDALQALSELTGLRSADYKCDEARLKRDVVNEVARLTPSNQPVEVEQYRVGLDGPANTCIQILENMGAGPGMLGLVGMGGIGKTTLAREIYNHFAAQKRFKHMTFLEIHRDPSSSNVQVRPTQSMELRKQLLWDLLSVQDSTSNYSSWFQKVSTLGPVFIVVDDVHKLGQFEELIPFTSGLHAGSRIMVTSRDRGILSNVGGRAELGHHLFDVPTLNSNESNMLFNWHAFQAKEAPEGYEIAAKDVVRACGGLPLALKVIGSSLFDKRLDGDRETIWPEAVVALRKSTDVMGVLRWSYDSLPESEKLMFVDITCLFCDMCAEEAFAYWESCKECTSCGGVHTPHTSLRNLINKNLVVSTLDHRSRAGFRVHDLLRELGKEIGMRTKRHFVNGWTAEAAVTKSQGSEKTMGLNLIGSQVQHFEAENFANMPNLHYLQLPNGCEVSGDFRCMSRELRLLWWTGMPYANVPVGLNFSHLTELDFSDSTNLASLWTKSNESLEGCPNLHHLSLRGCTSITKLPNSIGQSSRLQHLDLSSCKNLEKLPESIGQLKALKWLNLAFCSHLKALPDSIGALFNLQSLYAFRCKSLVKIPTSIGLLSSLERLHISDSSPECKVASDANIGEAWTRLRELRIFNCGGLRSLIGYGALKSLIELSLRDSTLIELPESLGLLEGLMTLQIYDCERLQMECLPKSFADLKMLMTLYLGDCKKLKRLPKNLGALTSLKYLSVRNCPIRKLPKCIGLLSKLQTLSITNCKNLQNLPTSIRQLERLWKFILDDCGNTETTGALSTCLQGLLECGALNSLETLRLQECALISELPDSLGRLECLRTLNIMLERLQSLPNSIGDLKMLETLELSQCHNLKKLPKTLGALSSLQELCIKFCPIRSLPKSLGLLSQLRSLLMAGCKNLQKLPTSIRQLHSLREFELRDCGGIEAMGALTTLQGLPIWGSTCITKLPASLGVVSTLIVYDAHYSKWRWHNGEYRQRDDAYFYGTIQVLEEDRSGFLKACQVKSSGQIELLRGVHESDQHPFHDVPWWET